jgi:predicted secreted protein
VCGPAAALAEGESPSYNVVSLSAEASTTVANDLLVAVVGATAEGSTVGGPADEVNKAVNWALELARGSAGVTVRTLAYRTSPVYRDNRLRGWRVQQSIRLESADSESLGDLIGRLQERLALESLGFELSSARRLEAEQALIARALAAFRERANLVTRELGRSGYRLVRAGVITGGAPPPRPMLRGGVAMAAEAVAPPVIEAGDQELTVRVDGAIEVTED